MNERIIFSNAYLIKNDYILRKVIQSVDNKHYLTRNSTPFQTLANAIIGQQISVAAASSVLKKLKLNINGFTPKKVYLAGNIKLKNSGLSRQKIKYVRALAAAKINYQDLESLESNKVIEILTNVLGIGRWTAEIYLMFSLGRANIFPAGDLALQEAYRILYKLPERPNEKKMRDLAARWSPWMSISARGLWSYYSHMKRREGIR